MDQCLKMKFPLPQTYAQWLSEMWLVFTNTYCLFIFLQVFFSLRAWKVVLEITKAEDDQNKAYSIYLTATCNSKILTGKCVTDYIISIPANSRR